MSLSQLVSRTGCEIRLYRFLTVAFSSTVQFSHQYGVVKWFISSPFKSLGCQLTFSSLLVLEANKSMSCLTELRINSPSRAELHIDSTFTYGICRYFCRGITSLQFQSETACPLLVSLLWVSILSMFDGILGHPIRKLTLWCHRMYLRLKWCQMSVVTY